MPISWNKESTESNTRNWFLEDSVLMETGIIIKRALDEGTSH